MNVFNENQKHVERFTFRNTEGRQLCDAVTAMIIDLSQAEEIAKKPVSDMTLIEQWTVFFALGNMQTYRGIIAEMTKLEEGIAVANDTLTSISQNPDERARFRSRRIWLQDREHDDAVIAEQNAELAEQKEKLAENAVELAEKDAKLAEKDAKLEEKDAELAEKDAIIAKLRSQLEEN